MTIIPDRVRCLVAYSPNLRCAYCQDNWLPALQIDHMDGGGRYHYDDTGRKLSGNALAKYLIKNNFPPGFQVLCASCNFVKRTMTDQKFREKYPERIATSKGHTQTQKFQISLDTHDLSKFLSILHECENNLYYIREPEPEPIDVSYATHRTELSRLQQFMDVLKKLEGVRKEPVEEITLIQNLTDTGKFTVDDVRAYLGKLKREGVVYEPRKGYCNRSMA